MGINKKELNTFLDSIKILIQKQTKTNIQQDENIKNIVHLEMGSFCFNQQSIVLKRIDRLEKRQDSAYKELREILIKKTDTLIIKENDLEKKELELENKLILHKTSDNSKVDRLSYRLKVIGFTIILFCSSVSAIIGAMWAFFKFIYN